MVQNMINMIVTFGLFTRNKKSTNLLSFPILKKVLHEIGKLPVSKIKVEVINRH